MAVAIPVADEPFRARRFRCYTAAKMTNEFIERPYLHVQQLKRAAAPAIDECTLLLKYGQFSTREADDFGNPQRFGTTDPLTGVHTGYNVDSIDLNRHYVRVELIETADPPTDPPVVLWKWWGVIEVDDHFRTRDPDTPTVDTGDQRLTAYGLLRELETEQIVTAEIQDATGSRQTIGRPLTFNQYFGDAFPERANRTEAEVATGDPDDPNGYIFSWHPTQNFDSDVSNGSGINGPPRS